MLKTKLNLKLIKSKQNHNKQLLINHMTLHKNKLMQKQQWYLVIAVNHRFIKKYTKLLLPNQIKQQSPIKKSLINSKDYSVVLNNYKEYCLLISKRISKNWRNIKIENKDKSCKWNKRIRLKIPFKRHYKMSNTIYLKIKIHSNKHHLLSRNNSLSLIFWIK